MRQLYSVRYVTRDGLELWATVGTTETTLGGICMAAFKALPDALTILEVV